MPKFCPDCGNQLKDGAKFCDKCGSGLAQNQTDTNGIVFMCSRCGTPIDNPYGICPSCGKSVNENSDGIKAVLIIVGIIVAIILISMFAGFLLIMSA